MISAKSVAISAQAGWPRCLGIRRCEGLSAPLKARRPRSCRRSSSPATTSVGVHRPRCPHGSRVPSAVPSPVSTSCGFRRRRRRAPSSRTTPRASTTRRRLGNCASSGRNATSGNADRRAHSGTRREACPRLPARTVCRVQSLGMSCAPRSLVSGGWSSHGALHADRWGAHTLRRPSARSKTWTRAPPRFGSSRRRPPLWHAPEVDIFHRRIEVCVMGNIARVTLSDHASVALRLGERRCRPAGPQPIPRWIAQLSRFGKCHRVHSHDVAGGVAGLRGGALHDRGRAFGSALHLGRYL